MASKRGWWRVVIEHPELGKRKGTWYGPTEAQAIRFHTNEVAKQTKTQAVEWRLVKTELTIEKHRSRD